MKRTQKKLTRKQKVHRNAIIDAALGGNKIYIKNTGVEVIITDFTERRNRNNFNSRYRFDIEVKLMDKPTAKSLEKFQYYNIELASNAPNLRHEVKGEIKIADLSTKPFDTAASRILHGPRC